MLDFVSFFEGHKGAVLSLAGDPEENYFYSSGIEGLIVRWSLNKPNEGDVITRLPGLVPSICYSKNHDLIYAAINQKGIIAMDSTTGKKVNSVAIPATSFNRLLLLDDYLIVNTNKSELLIIEANTLKVVFRIKTGTSEPPLIASTNKTNTFWFKDTKGLQLMNLANREVEKSLFAELTGNSIGIGAMGDYLMVLEPTEMIIQNTRKKSSNPILLKSAGDTFSGLHSGVNAPALLAVTNDHAIMELKITGKTIENGLKSKILHNGPINDLLWSENHKFVLSASADKYIGVWRFN